MDRPVCVCVAYDERATSTPAWMAGWLHTSMTLTQEYGTPLPPWSDPDDPDGDGDPDEIEPGSGGTRWEEYLRSVAPHGGGGGCGSTGLDLLWPPALLWLLRRRLPRRGQRCAIFL